MVFYDLNCIYLNLQVIFNEFCTKHNCLSVLWQIKFKIEKLTIYNDLKINS